LRISNLILSVCGMVAFIGISSVSYADDKASDPELLRKQHEMHPGEQNHPVNQNGKPAVAAGNTTHTEQVPAQGIRLPNGAENRAAVQHVERPTTIIQPIPMQQPTNTRPQQAPVNSSPAINSGVPDRMHQLPNNTPQNRQPILPSSNQPSVNNVQGNHTVPPLAPQRDRHPELARSDRDGNWERNRAQIIFEHHEEHDHPRYYREMPHGYRTYIIAGITYFFLDNLWYVMHDDMYEQVEQPSNITIINNQPMYTMPYNNGEMAIIDYNGIRYYVKNGRYYRREINDLFLEVTPPF